MKRMLSFMVLLVVVLVSVACADPKTKGNTYAKATASDSGTFNPGEFKKFEADASSDSGSGSNSGSFSAPMDFGWEITALSGAELRIDFEGLEAGTVFYEYILSRPVVTIRGSVVIEYPTRWGVRTKTCSFTSEVKFDSTNGLVQESGPQIIRRLSDISSHSCWVSRGDMASGTLSVDETITSAVVADGGYAYLRILYADRSGSAFVSAGGSAYTVWHYESGGGGGGGKIKWRLRLESWPVNTTVRVGDKVYVTPVEFTYSTSSIPRGWDIPVKFYPSGGYGFAYANVTVKSSHWAYSCAEKDDLFRLYSSDFVLSVTADTGEFGREMYEIELVEPSETRKLVRYCFLTIVVRAVLSNSTLTVKTNIDSVRSEAAVKFNGTWVETPFIHVVYGNVTLEAKPRVATNIWLNVSAEAVGLPSGWMTPKACGDSATECEFSSEPLTGEYVVSFEWKSYWSTVYTLVRVYAGDRLIWESPYTSGYKTRSETLNVTLKNEPLRFVLYRLSGYRGDYPKVKVESVKERLYAVFKKWVVHDEFGNEVLDPPTDITVNVPVGKRWTAVAYYTTFNATVLVVESWPWGVEVSANGTVRATPFALTRETGFTVLLEAPQVWQGFHFVNWTVYDSSGAIVATSSSPETVVTVPSGEYYRAVAFYRVEYECRRINSSVYYLGYQWVPVNATLSPGLWFIDSSPASPNPANSTLIYATLMASNHSFMLVPARRLLVNVTEPVSLPALSCEGDYCEPKLAVEALNYSGYYLVGLGVGDWTKPAETEEALEALLLPNGTTLAVYNVTLYNASGGVGYWLPVVVTSLRFELDALYAEEGVYLVWNVSYSHLAPEWVHEWLNVTSYKPYQLLKCRIYRGGRKLWEQGLWTLPEGLELPDNPYSSYAGLYVPYSELREKFGFDTVTLEARVEWEAIHVPLAQSAEVRFAPLALGVSLDRDGRWRWTVYPVELRGYEEGVPVRLGGKLIVLFNGSRLELEPGGLDYDVFTFETPPFEVGHGTLVLRYVPPRTRNLVYYLYPADF